MSTDQLNHSCTTSSLDSLEHFLEFVEIPRFRKNLRYLLFSYLMNEHESLMPDFKWFIEGLHFFFKFLDELEATSNEMTSWENKAHNGPTKNP